MKQPTRLVLFFCFVLAVIGANVFLHGRHPEPAAAQPSPSSAYQPPSLPPKSSSGPLSSSGSSSLPGSSSSVPGKEDKLALYRFGTIQVAVPSRYLPYLKIETVPQGISVWEKASLEQAQADTGYPGGFLFNIAAISPEEVPAFIADDRPGSYIFAQDGQWYYAFTGPTDVQLYRSDGVTDADQELWDQMYQFSQEVAEDTRLRNELSPYTPAATPVPEIPDSSSLYQPQPVECPTCHGGFLCIQCGGVGSCTRCGGSGKTICTSCSGMSHCMSCGGRGYIYAGVGLAHRQEKCSRCGGTGDCRTCQNTGRMTCTSCYGSPDCFFCRGLGLCPTCNGTGYLW